MGIFGEGREQSENSEGHNYAPNQFSPAGSPSHNETLMFTDNMEEKREPIPSMEEPLEAEMHVEETIREGNQAEATGPLEPPAKENPTEETLEGENQPGSSIFMKSPEDEAHIEEDLENDNFSGDTIPLGSPGREAHGDRDLEGENPSGETIPLEPHPDVDTIPLEHEPEVNTSVPLPIRSPTTKNLNIQGHTQEDA